MSSMLSWIHSCCRASLGFILKLGSHARHLHIKSKKFWSSLLTAYYKVFVPGSLRIPLEFVTIFGYICPSKNNLILELFSRKCFGGTPKISIMQAICSCSFSPGNNGYPLCNSAKMQPRLHMSIAWS